MIDNGQKPRGYGRLIATVSLLVSGALFIVSLTQDCFFIDRPSDPRAWAPGIVLLTVGWVAVFDGVLAWLANPAVFTAAFLLLIGCHRAAAATATVAAALATSFLLYQRIITNENGDHSLITGYGPGYWLWTASMFAVLIGSIAEVALGAN